MLKLLLAIGLLGLALGINLEPATSEWIKISCDHNKDFLRNVSCELKAVRRYIKLLKINLEVYKPMSTLNFRIRNLKKTSANRFMPGMLDLSRDLCAVMTGPGKVFLENLVKYVYEEGLVQFRSFFRECPYSGKFLYEELIDEKNSSSASYLEPGEYQTEVTFFSNDNLLYFALRTYFKLKYRKQ